MFELHICMYVHCLYARCLQKSEKGSRTPWTGVSFEPPCKCLVKNPGPLQEHQVLLAAEPSL